MMDKNLTAMQIQELPHDTHKEHLAVTRDWIVLFASVGVASVLVTAALGVAVAATAPLWIVLPLLTMFFYASIVAMIVLRALEYARYALHERFGQWVKNQEAAREIARITAMKVTNVSVRGRQNVVSVNSQGQTAESVRLVGVSLNRPTRLLDGIDERDLIFFCERVPLIGHSQRAWMGTELPSGRRITTFADYDKLLQPLCKAGLIADRRERSAGHLVTNDAGDIKRALGLTSGTAPEAEAGTKDVTPAT